MKHTDEKKKKRKRKELKGVHKALSHVLVLILPIVCPEVTLLTHFIDKETEAQDVICLRLHNCLESQGSAQVSLTLSCALSFKREVHPFTSSLHVFS